MTGNGKVFISHSHDDNDLCQPLLQALGEWKVDYWFDTERVRPGDFFSHQIEKEIEERDVLIRVCSPAAQNSFWVGLETDAFRSLLADEFNQGRNDKRRLIYLILHPDYKMEPFVRASRHVDARGKPQAQWIKELQSALTHQEPAPPALAPPALPSSAGISTFVDDDRGYEAWVSSHPDGYILNCYRSPSPEYVMLHKARCGWIRRPIEKKNNLTYAYIKICSSNRSDLEDWTRKQIGSEAEPCGLCKP
jgi:hypothetical protein